MVVGHPISVGGQRRIAFFLELLGSFLEVFVFAFHLRVVLRLFFGRLRPNGAGERHAFVEERRVESRTGFEFFRGSSDFRRCGWGLVLLVRR